MIDEIRLIVLYTDACEENGQFRLYLNSEFNSRTVVGEHPTGDCTLSPPISTFSFTDPEFLAAWQMGTNRLTLIGTGSCINLSWARLEVVSGGDVESVCLIDYGEGSCSDPDLCRGYSSFVGYGVTTDIFPVGVEGTEVITAEDCERFVKAGQTSLVINGAGCEGGGDPTCAQVEVIAAQHTVGQGSRPSTTKEPLADILVRAYERGPGSCIDQQAPNGASWQDYPAIVANCTPVNTGTTNASGMTVIDLPPGDYVIISHLAAQDTYLGEWVNNLACGETITKRLQLMVANGTPRPGKTTRLTGSELLIIEPEYVIWDDSTQVYPFVLESVGSWGVTASVAPPDGFVADYSSLEAQVESEIEAVQFTITEEGSDLVPTRTTFQVTHANRRHTLRSEVAIGLTPEYARARGFDVTELRGRGLIVDRDRRGGDGHGGKAGPPEAFNARLADDDKPKPSATSTKGKESEPTLGAPDVSRTLGLAVWPSPFSGNGVLRVAFGLPDGALPPDLELGLFDVLGRRVATIPSDLSVGRDGVAHLAWDGAEIRRGDVAPGVYFLQALAPSVGMRTECKLVVTR